MYVHVLRASVSPRKVWMAGFTTVPDLGRLLYTRDLLAVALSNASNAGCIDAPRILAAGHSVTIAGGHAYPEMLSKIAAGLVASGPDHGVINTAGDAVKAVRFSLSTEPEESRSWRLPVSCQWRRPSARSRTRK